MTINTTASIRRRLEPVAPHAYTVPVVRELPARALDSSSGLTW
jgi:hypothetical protein